MPPPFRPVIFERSPPRAAAGDRVIVDDLRYFSELSFQDGVIAQAVDQVAAQGVAYFGSAGNDLTAGYGGAFVAGGTQVIDGQTYTLMQFAPGRNYMKVLNGIIRLQWDPPAASAGGAGSANDLDLFVLDPEGNVVASSTANNLGGDPYEAVEIKCRRNANGDVVPYRLVVAVAPGSQPPGLIQLMNHGGLLEPLASNINNTTMVGHHGAAGSMVVGATSFAKTPAYGIDPVLAEYHTSAGYQTRLFDDNGVRLAAPEIGAVAFTAVDDGNTTFFGDDSDAYDVDNDPDNDPNFLGTSAAAPDAAGTAALLLSIRPDLTPADIRALLAASAIAPPASSPRA